MDPLFIWLCIAAALIILLIIFWVIIRYHTRKTEKMLGDEAVSSIKEYLHCPKCTGMKFTPYRDGIITCYSCKTLYYDHGIFGITEYKHPSNSNNPFDLVNGEVAILDEERANKSIVTIRTITPRGIYAAVTDGEDTWNVMTCRLSLPSYYVSFNQAHIINGLAVKDYYLEVKARTYIQVQEFLDDLIPNRYFYIYPILKEQYYPKGRLALFIINKPIIKKHGSVTDTNI